MRVCVVVVNYNGGEMILRCVESVMRQNYAAAALIIIDNGSTDDSVQRLREKYPRLRIVEAHRNIGFARANNIAFRLYRQKVDFFALLNPDAYAEPGWLAALMGAAAEHPEYAAFGSRCYAGNNMLMLDGVGDSYHISGLAWRKAHGSPDSARYNYEADIFSPCAAAHYIVATRYMRRGDLINYFIATLRM
jgi:GT2 family glycosyltransferase